MRLLRALLVLAATGCTGVLVGSDDTDSPDVVFEIVWRDFDRYYASFALRGINWDSLHQVYAPQAAAVTSTSQLTNLVGRLMAELRDPHVDLRDGDQIIASSVVLQPTAFSASLVQTYFTGMRSTPSSRIRYARNTRNIGYIYLQSFSGTNWAHEIDVALQFFGTSTEGVIIDIRDNTGGSSRTAETIASRFMDQRREFAFVRYRSGPGHGDFSDYLSVMIEPAGERRFNGPVVLLTNRLTTSASERFTLAMRVRPNTRIMGDTTTGAFSNPLFRELPNGWTFRVPQSIEYDADRVTHEGVGLGPDTLIPFGSTDLANGRDPQLEAAIDWLVAVTVRDTRAHLSRVNADPDDE